MDDFCSKFIRYNKHQIGDLHITVRSDNGYINSTDICKRYNKKISSWLRLVRTEKFLRALKEEMGISEPVIKQCNTYTWIHPLVLSNLLYWFAEPELEITVCKWMKDSFYHDYVKKSDEEIREIESKHDEKDIELKDLKAKFSDLKIKHDNLVRTHNILTLKKRRYTLGKGNCFYLISDPGDPNIIKMGITCNIDGRLKTHRTSRPQLNLEFLMFIENNIYVENLMKAKYKENMVHRDYEVINGISIEEASLSAITIAKSFTDEFKVIDKEGLDKYNNELVSKKRGYSPDPNLKEKRCPGPLHTDENRMVPVSMFYTNRSAKNGYGTYCKDCEAHIKYGEHTRKPAKIYEKLEYDEITHHHCITCRQVLLREDFAKSSRTRSGLQANCRSCADKKRREIRARKKLEDEKDTILKS